MSGSDVDRDDTGFASRFAGAEPSLHDEVMALRREVNNLRNGRGGSGGRGTRRSSFDPHPALSARTVRRRTGIVMLVAMTLLALGAIYVGFELLRATAQMIGGLFAPRIVGVPGLVGAVAALFGFA